MLDTPQIIQTTAQLTAVIPIVVPREKIREVMGPGLRELMSAIAAQGVSPTGPWFTHHRKMDPDIFDFEISVPVNKPVTTIGRVQPSELPARRVVRTIYHGDYEGLGEAWGEFIDWIEANGHPRAADLWECYVYGPESTSDETAYRTELNQPLLD